MAVYWTTFRIHNDASYQHRYEKLMEAIRVISIKWWVDPTSFLLFESNQGIDGVASAIKAAINSTTDMALVGMPDFKDARAIGHTHDQDLFALMPFTKKA
jgi:hypothetical protein